MASSSNVSFVSETSRLSSVLGVWTKRTEFDPTILSDATEVDACRESPPPNFSLPTLARMLFTYGFLFFPFWLAGICILRSPLLPTPDWEAGKTKEEKAQLLQRLRKTELKWAHRCLWAMLSLLATVFLLALIINFYLSNTL